MGRKRTASKAPVQQAESQFRKRMKQYEQYQYQGLSEMPEWDLSKYDLDLEKYKQENILEDMPGMEAYKESADYAAEQFQQSQANIMQAYKGAAGSSGVAGIAQAMSGQATKFAREQQMGLGERAAEARRLSLQEQARLQGQERQLLLQQDVGRRDLRLAEDRTKRDFDYGKMTTMLGVEAEQLGGARQMYASQLQADAQRSSGISSMIGSVAGAVGTVAAAKVGIPGACIAKGVCIDTVSGSVPIEDINVGDMVIGYDGNPTEVIQKHAYKEDPKSPFYDIKIDYNGKTRVVNVGAWHKIMNIPASDIKENIIEKNEYNGVEFSYDLLTEDAGYRIDCVPVNSMIEEMAEEIVKLKNK